MDAFQEVVSPVLGPFLSKDYKNQNSPCEGLKIPISLTHCDQVWDRIYRLYILERDDYAHWRVSLAVGKRKYKTRSRQAEQLSPHGSMQPSSCLPFNDLEQHPGNQDSRLFLHLGCGFSSPSNALVREEVTEQTPSGTRDNKGPKLSSQSLSSVNPYSKIAGGRKELSSAQIRDKRPHTPHSPSQRNLDYTCTEKLLGGQKGRPTQRPLDQNPPWLRDACEYTHGRILR